MSTAPADDAAASGEKPAAHALFFPFPAQGHVTPALHLARLFHVRGGVRVTFVHTDRNRRRILRSRGPGALAGAPPGFVFASVPDGLPPPPPSGEVDDTRRDTPQDMDALVSSIMTSAPTHLRKLLDDAAAAGAPATCVVSDVESVLRAAAVAGVPAVAFWTASACGLMASLLCQPLIDKGFVPLKDAAQLSNGYLDTVIDWAPGMPADMRLRDFLSFIRTTDPDDAVLRRVIGLMDAVRTAASAVVLNTFDELEREVVAAVSALLPPPAPIYTVGPLPLLAEHIVAGCPLDAVAAASANFTKEDDGCLAWLDSKRPRSVVYANFGSITVLTAQQVEEFAWGLANSGYEFLLVIRDDGHDGGGVTPEFVEETKGRGYVTSWCSQAAVLRHEAVGAFLTHCGWNSTLESMCCGVPMMCWPFGADQQTNCRFACTEWRVGIEVGGDDVSREEVERLVRDVMGGEKGVELRRRAAEWKEKAAAAASQPGGSSWVNLERLVKEVFHPCNN
ncbi:unnamed protein product [Urochloa decumbens]|uniref:Glycosyltransferase n=1 Tax=Urochloa decumbens TaxID=240449 RepID=A0ABC9EJR3_9POAL